jgi:signal transduction histidine kinase
VTPAGLFDPTPGPLLWVHAAWKFGAVLLGAALLVRRDGNSQGVIGLQSVAILVTGLLPPVAATVELLDVVTIPGFDFGVVGVAAGSAFLLWALFYADFLDVVPIARETMLASMTDAVVAVDTAGRVVDLNRRAKRLFDVDAEAVGTRASDMLSGYPELLDGGGVRSETAEVTGTVDGDVRHYEFESTPIRPPSSRSAPWVSSDGEAIGRLLVFDDVTLRKRHEQNIERKNARLEEFASVLSHDLRNPLNVAQGNVDLAREACEEGDEYLPTATNALDRMEHLIEEVLMLARQGKTVEEMEPVDLTALAEQCWAGILTGEASLAVESERTILADRSRLRAVFENLFRNSVEHGSTTSRAGPDDAVGHGGTGVTVTVGDLDDERGFFVADDGVGIPEAERGTVLESGYSTRPDGHGIGLAIVRAVAEAHGWRVTVTESDGGGARFEFADVELGG